MATASMTRTKAAWISDKTAPVGFPSLGHFDCSCGSKVEGVAYGQAEPVACPDCDTRYDGKGWIVLVAGR